MINKKIKTGKNLKIEKMEEITAVPTFDFEFFATR
jgi:hypothetical protein